MSQLVGLVIVCLTLVSVVVSCSAMSVETERIRAASREACYDRGGSVNMWTSLCDLPTPNHTGETK